MYVYIDCMFFYKVLHLQNLYLKMHQNTEFTKFSIIQGMFFSHLLLCIVAYSAGNFWTIEPFCSHSFCPIGYCGLLYQWPLIDPDIILPLVQSVDFLLFLLLLVWLSSFLWNQIGTQVVFHVSELEYYCHMDVCILLLLSMSLWCVFRHVSSQIFSVSSLCPLICLLSITRCSLASKIESFLYMSPSPPFVLLDFCTENCIHLSGS